MQDVRVALIITCVVDIGSHGTTIYKPDISCFPKSMMLFFFCYSIVLYSKNANGRFVQNTWELPLQVSSLDSKLLESQTQNKMKLVMSQITAYIFLSHAEY